MKNQMFAFKKAGNKYQSEINPEFIVEMYTTHGLPVELVIEKIKNLTPRERLMAKIKSWKTYVEKENIDIGSLREEVEDNKEYVMSCLNNILS